MEVSEGLVCQTLQKHHQGELEFGFPVLSQIKRITVSEISDITDRAGSKTSYSIRQETAKFKKRAGKGGVLFKMSV